MRAWTLCGAALCASVVAAISLVLILILFLSLYTGQLPIENNQRSLMQGIQVMLYLLPFLVVWAWCCYLVIFALFQVPTRVWQIGQLLRVLIGIFLAWWALMLIVVAVDFSFASIWQALKFSLLSYSFFLFPITAGLGCGNIFYFIVQAYQQQQLQLLWKKSVL